MGDCRCLVQLTEAWEMGRSSGRPLDLTWVLHKTTECQEGWAGFSSFGGRHCLHPGAEFTEAALRTMVAEMIPT